MTCITSRRVLGTDSPQQRKRQRPPVPNAATKVAREERHTAGIHWLHRSLRCSVGDAHAERQAVLGS